MDDGGGDGGGSFRVKHGSDAAEGAIRVIITIYKGDDNYNNSY